MNHILCETPGLPTIPYEEIRPQSDSERKFILNKINKFRNQVAENGYEKRGLRVPYASDMLKLVSCILFSIRV